MRDGDGKVVVTGGAGFIGSHLARRLSALGHQVIVFDDLSFGSESRIPQGVRFHKGDIRDTEDLLRLLPGTQTIFHLAAISSVPLSLEDPSLVVDVNTRGTASVLDAARRTGVKRVVLASSSAVYGDQSVDALHEELPPRPQSPYGMTKLQAEHWAALISECYGIETVSLRLFNVYGPGQDPNGPYAAVVARFVQARKAGAPLQVTGDGGQTRDLIAVRDVVEANILAMRSDKVGKGEALNIGTGRRVSILELARQIGGPIEFVPKRQEIRDSRADIAKAGRLLGFGPTTALKEGIAEMLGYTLAARNLLSARHSSRAKSTCF